MNPSSPQAPNVNDPTQSLGQMPAGNQPPVQSSVQSQMPQLDSNIPAPELASGAAATTPQTSDPAGAQSQQNAQASPANDVTTTTNSLAAKIIDDKDLIEKEYVEKAMKIVEANRGDPYKQSEELTEFRAEYMQKEYNKTIKTDK